MAADPDPILGYMDMIRSSSLDETLLMMGNIKARRKYAVCPCHQIKCQKAEKISIDAE